MASPTKATREQYVIDRKGKKKGVILPLAEYERIIEDLHDLAVVAERREETPISLNAMKRRLQQHGRI